MFEQNVPADRRAEVLHRFDELANLQTAGDIGDDEVTRLRRMRTYNDKSDELRKLFADLKLPDPGPALPPPAQSRLGITIEGEGPDGVIVGKVLEGSRGARAGLKSGDRIISANGKAVKSAVDLRKLVSGPDKLEITVTRDGAERILEEKPAKAK
jgi:S1-C subfamily serine protease